MKIRKVFLIFFIMIFSAFAFVACKTTQPKTAQLYIKKYMDKEALEIQQAVTCSKVERVGDSIKITFIDKIFFDHDMFELKPEAQASINNMIMILKKYGKTKNIVQGHTDDTGTEEYNFSLSFKRAECVKTYMINNGLAENRFTAYGVGATQPVASNDTEHGRALNRRVVIWVAADFALRKEASQKAETKM